MDGDAGKNEAVKGIVRQAFVTVAVALLDDVVVTIGRRPSQCHY
jgi:hypothetical protein